jgi:hypothetical protein
VLLASEKHTIRVGLESICWHTSRRLVLLISDHSLVYPDIRSLATDSPAWRLMQYSLTWDRSDRLSNHPKIFLALIQQFQETTCSDVRDRIYSLGALWAFTSSPIKAEYGKSPAVLFWDVLFFLASSDGSRDQTRGNGGVYIDNSTTRSIATQGNHEPYCFKLLHQILSVNTAQVSLVMSTKGYPLHFHKVDNGRFTTLGARLSLSSSARIPEPGNVKAMVLNSVNIANWFPSYLTIDFGDLASRDRLLDYTDEVGIIIAGSKRLLFESRDRFYAIGIRMRSKTPDLADAGYWGYGYLNVVEKLPRFVDESPYKPLDKLISYDVSLHVVIHHCSTRTGDCDAVDAGAILSDNRLADYLDECVASPRKNPSTFCHLVSGTCIYQSQHIFEKSQPVIATIGSIHPCCSTTTCCTRRMKEDATIWTKVDEQIQREFRRPLSATGWSIADAHLRQIYNFGVGSYLLVGVEADWSIQEDEGNIRFVSIIELRKFFCELLNKRSGLDREELSGLSEAMEHQDSDRFSRSRHIHVEVYKRCRGCCPRLYSRGCFGDNAHGTKSPACGGQPSFIPGAESVLPGYGTSRQHRRQYCHLSQHQLISRDSPADGPWSWGRQRVLCALKGASCMREYQSCVDLHCLCYTGRAATTNWLHCLDPARGRSINKEASGDPSCFLPHDSQPYEGIDRYTSLSNPWQYYSAPSERPVVHADSPNDARRR